MYGRRAAAMCRSLTRSPCWETQVCSPEADLPPLILPVVVTDINIAPETVSPPLILPVVVEESSVAPAVGLIELEFQSAGLLSVRVSTR